MKLFLCLLALLFALVAAKKKHGTGRTLIHEKHIKAQSFTKRASEIVTATPIPASFDSRTAWPKCPSIGQIRDQGNCGDCWAVAAASAITDRTCIASNSSANPILSSLDIMSCSLTWDGCQGGPVDAGWHYWVDSGVVTGGEAGTTGTCEPYNLASSSAPPCASSCVSGYAKSFSSDKHFGKSAYVVPSNVTSIQKEIMTNGPVETGFTVYSDFYNDYESGVYYKGYLGYKPANEGGHAVKIIGWGTDNGTDYWLIANSWGTWWGENGFFRIRRGTNECGIESDVVAGMAK